MIEIVIVILLVAVLGALFVPRLLQQQDSFKVEAAAEQIANHIRLAQSRAIAQHITHGVWFGTTPTNQYSVYSKTAGPTYIPIKNPLRKNKDLIVDFRSGQEYTDSQLKDVLIDNAEFPAGSGVYSVEFSALGAPNYSGYLSIKKGTTEERRIGVELQTGAVSVWTP